MDNTSAHVACIQWLKAESIRFKYAMENMPSASSCTRRLFAAPFPFDVNRTSALFDAGVEAVLEGDYDTAIRNVREAQSLINSVDNSLKRYGAERFSERVDAVVELLNEGNKAYTRFLASSVWFELTHSWRSKASKGVPSIPDFSQFMVIEKIFTIFLVVIGLIVPTLQSEGIYRCVPFVLMSVMCVAYAWAGCARNTTMRWGVWYWVFFVMGLVPALYFEDHMSRWVLWSFGGGSLIGTLTGNHIAYRRSRRMATKYGPFACLWARHVKDRTYEFAMVTTSGDLAWYYQAQGWARHVDPCLGGDLSIVFRAEVRHKGWESKPLGGWFACYPGLTATRMHGRRRRNPVDMVEACNTTPGIEDAFHEFFDHVPSPLGPPAHLMTKPPTILPRHANIPW